MNAEKNLHKLMNLDCLNLVSIIKTADGYYLGQRLGDCGYNEFIGKPGCSVGGPGHSRTVEIWKQLSKDEQRQVLVCATARRIDLAEEFGVPVQ